jgi:hypothetical protein
MCKVNSLGAETDGSANPNKNKAGIALKGYLDNGTFTNGNGKGIEYDNKEYVGLGWKKLEHTFTLTSNLHKAELYVYIARNGDVQFTEFKIEKSKTSTAWIPEENDLYNNGINLYTGDDRSIGSISSTSNYQFYDFCINDTFKPDEGKPYYFYAKI